MGYNETMNMSKALNKTGFSPAGQQVADYLKNQPWKAAGMTLQDIACEVFLSPATVLRVVRKCGYDSWRAFAAGLLLYSESARQQPESVNMSRPFGMPGSSPAIVSSIKSLFEQTVQEAAAMLSLEDLEKAAGLLPVA